MKKILVILLSSILTFSAFAKDGGGKNNLSPEDIAKLEKEYNAFIKDQHEDRVKFEKEIFELKEEYLEESEKKTLSHLDEMWKIKSKMKFGDKEGNKALKKEMKSKSKEFKKSMKKSMKKDHRNKIKEMRKEFHKKQKEERKAFKEKMKSYKKS